MAEHEREPEGKPESAPPAEVFPDRADVRVPGGPTRCAFCHDDVDPEAGGWVACRTCLARHHLGCWGEAGACSICGKHTFVGDGVSSRPPRAAFAVIAITMLGATLAGLISFVPFGCLGAAFGKELGLVVLVLGVGVSVLFGGWLTHQLARRT
jgi:hypothetical protein